MKLKKMFTLFCIIAVAVLFTTACDSDDSNDPGTTISVAKVSSGGSTTYNYVYFSFKDGIVDEAKAGTTEWDLRFSASSKIQTNSGETATLLSSSGTGGAAYTGSTDFGTAIDTSALSIKVDTKPWIKGMGPAAETLMSEPISFPG